MLRTPRASVCLESKTVFNVLIACWSSTSDQAESASLACSIEHVHNFTVILPHRMQGMIPLLFVSHHTRAESWDSTLVGGPVGLDVLEASSTAPPPRQSHARQRAAEQQ
jgi:hypothetical protein